VKHAVKTETKAAHKKMAIARSLHKHKQVLKKAIKQLHKSHPAKVSEIHRLHERLQAAHAELATVRHLLHKLRHHGKGKSSSSSSHSSSSVIKSLV